MASSSTTGAPDPVIEQLTKLKNYARKALVDELELSEAELDDKESRLLAVRELGVSYGLSEKVIVKLIFGGMLRDRKRCGCPTCRARRQMQNERGAEDGPPSLWHSDSAA